MSGCTLRFARDSPLRTTLIDEATGHAKYKIATPIKIARSVTRIRKFDSPPQPPLHWDKDADSDSGGDITDKKKKSSSKKCKKDSAKGGEKEMGPAETSDEMARIYWKWFSPDRIVFRGRVTTRREFLPKTGKMKGSFMFTGPDGVQYRWALGAMGKNLPKLVTTDDKKTVIAQFHRAHYFTKKRKARLEIQSAGMDMLDYIILTFVIVDNARRDREAAAHSAG